MVQRYPTALTEAAWTLLAPLIPAAKRGGRPRTTDMREVIKAIVYVLRGGCQWRLLPQEFPPHQTVYHSFRTWRCAGVWERIHDTLRGDLREASGRTREPSAGLSASQTVKTTAKGGAAARTAASASAAASAPSSSMSAGCSSSSSCMRRGARTGMGPKRCSGPSAPAVRDWN
jgi:putative transposase